MSNLKHLIPTLCLTALLLALPTHASTPSGESSNGCVVTSDGGTNSCSFICPGGFSTLVATGYGEATISCGPADCTTDVTGVGTCVTAVPHKYAGTCTFTGEGRAYCGQFIKAAA